MRQLFSPLRRATLLVMGALICAGAMADTWPTRPIRMVVPYSAGGSTDQLARAIQRSMSEQLGQPVVVENRAGAGGTVGTDHVARSAPDGYTLVFGNSAPSGVASLLRKLPYDVQKDFLPVSTVAFVPLALVASTTLPAKDFRAFMELAKRPGARVNYGSVGVGSMAHLTGEYLNEVSGLQTQHIPYTGGGALAASVLSGEVETGWFNPLDATTIVSSGRAHYLAVATPERLKALPDVPTVAEYFPGFSSTAWFGVLAPKGTPEHIVKRLNEVIVSALKDAEVIALIEAKMAEPRSSTPDEMARLIQKEIEQWRPVIVKNNIKL